MKKRLDKVTFVENFRRKFAELPTHGKATLAKP